LADFTKSAANFHASKNLPSHKKYPRLVGSDVLMSKSNFLVMFQNLFSILSNR